MELLNRVHAAVEYSDVNTKTPITSEMIDDAITQIEITGDPHQDGYYEMLEESVKDIVDQLIETANKGECKTQT